MKKTVFLAAAAVALASCSSDELVNNSAVNEAPIAFNVGQKNITRSTNLEDAKHYNFGVWAYKTRTSGDPTSQLVMDNYLVGYSNGSNLGYYKENASTWDGSAGEVTDHKSPWFYEKLGKKEYTYTGTDGFYKNDTEHAAFMSANDYQYLRYWDLAYTNTNFYAYAPYKSSGVSFENGIITVEKDANVAGYDDPAKHDFIYAGAQALNKNQHDVTLSFKHLGAQVKLRFYEDIDGYDVDIIDVTTSGSGIQATPATKTTTTDNTTTPATTTTTYATSSYYTVCGAKVDYSSSVKNPTATATYGDDATSKSSDNLLFKVPSGTIPEAVTSGDQGYATSETTYYAVPQPETSTTGFTFHVSYTLKAKDNNETITVHDARVFVPAKSGDSFVAAWQPNTIYTYTFKITRDATGTTDPNDKKIDPTDPDIPQTKALYPIVFDGATIEEYKTSGSEQNF